MPKTKETLLLEKALDERCREKREYGCEEVTIGFASQGKGDEIVDFMSMDAEEVFRCYELKVTLADLKTDNKLSFYGDYNYLVVSKTLYARNPSWGNYIPPYVGILAGKDLEVKRQAKKKLVPDQTRSMLKDSLLRSVFWKYENYKDAQNLQLTRSMQKEIADLQMALQEEKRKNERIVWTYQDYEFWYRKNHNDPSFSLEAQAKTERSEAQLNVYTWSEKNRVYECPACHHSAGENTPYCPYCGKDLRRRP